MRAACVLYGEGNVKGPRLGRNAWSSPVVSFGRRPAPVAESRKPPLPPAALTDCVPLTRPATTTRERATLKDVIQRVIEDTRTSWPQAHQYPPRLSRKFTRVSYCLLYTSPSPRDS